GYTGMFSHKTLLPVASDHIPGANGMRTAFDLIDEGLMIMLFHEIDHPGIANKRVAVELMKMSFQKLLSSALRQGKHKVEWLRAGFKRERANLAGIGVSVSPVNGNPFTGHVPGDTQGLKALKRGWMDAQRAGIFRGR